MDDAIPSEHVRWHFGRRRWQQLWYVANEKWKPRDAEWRDMPDFVYDAITAETWPTSTAALARGSKQEPR